MIHWLTDYDEQALQEQIDKRLFRDLLRPRAPRMKPNAARIRGVIRGWRMEEIGDRLMRRVRYLERLVDEQANHRTMDNILRK